MAQSYEYYKSIINHDLVFVFEHLGHVYGLFLPSLHNVINNNYIPVIETTEYTFISVFLLPVLLNTHNDVAITILSYLNSYSSNIIYKDTISLLIKAVIDTKNPINTDMTVIFMQYYNLKENK